MILEGIVTTLNRDGTPNIAPMGPIVEESMAVLHLRPFRTSQTYENLRRHPQGVFHVIDDVLLLASAAIGRLTTAPETIPTQRIRGRVLASACRWYEFEVESIDDSQERTSIWATVVHRGTLRDFFGFNRARHAVLEAAILATRLHLIERAEIERQMEALAMPVEKTAGPREHEAFALLRQYISEFYAAHEASGSVVSGQS